MTDEAERPLVTVIIPVYNAGSYLRPAVESILAQTYGNLEIIIIDDGSTDGCLQSIGNMHDPRMRILRQENAGKPAAVNRALELMRGDYFLLQDADDLSYPQRIERQLAALRAQPELAAVFVGNDLIVEDRVMAPVAPALSAEEAKGFINTFRNPAHDATGMYRRSMVRDLRYEPDLRIGEGVDFILRVGERFPVAVLGECLYSYRLNVSSLTHSEPHRILDYTNAVIRRACERRGLDFATHRRTVLASGETTVRKYDSALTFCMQSVVQSKRAGRVREAFGTAIDCLRLFPHCRFFYRPLLYCLAPVALIVSYQRRMARRRGWAP